MRVIVRTVSELCITAGTVIVLFVAYVLFWTGVKADSAMDHQVEVLEERWAERAAAPAPEPATAAGKASGPRRAAPRPPRPRPHRARTGAANPSPSCTSRASVPRGTSPC